MSEKKKIVTRESHASKARGRKVRKWINICPTSSKIYLRFEKDLD